MAYKLTFGGETWIGPDACSFGDYGGYGSIGRANIDELLEQAGDSIASMSYGRLHTFIEYTEKRRKPSFRGCFEDLLDTAKELRTRPDVIHVEGDFGSECILIREGWDADTIAALEDYPCLSDERVSQVEMQWEEEAWRDWLRGDLSRFIGKQGSERLGNYFDALDDGVAWELYREAMEAPNTYPVGEYNGVHVDVDSVGPELLTSVAQRYREERAKVVRDALQAYHEGQYDFIEGSLPDPEGVGKAAAREFNARFS
jgi:hypothetical protein